MLKNLSLPLSLIAVAIVSGCASVPPENTALNDARNSYNSARSNPQVTKLAPIELQEAGNALQMADSASTNRAEVSTVNQLSYLTKQKVAIAQETAKRKAAELDIANSSAKRDQVRLELRTAEADAAQKRAMLAQQSADQRATALAAANVKAEQDRAQIAARMVEIEAARKQAALAQQNADKQAAALAEAQAQSKQDQTLIAARMAEAEAARKQAALAQEAADKQAAALAQAQEAADKQAAALAEAQAASERNQALIAQQEKQLKELNAKKTDRGMVITLGDVLFNVDKAELSAGGINNVKKLAEFLNKYPQRKVMIEGHTDSRGSDTYNQALSERRAEAVQKALGNMGISNERVATRGYGESSPAATNDSAAGRQINRRVEIVLSDDGGNIVPHK
ncbi:MAG: OmpA family protein [Sulfuriferula multivorans]|uniref:OmpA family protein n=1 Tax=Sulfuriferula multivorans TaxID=1559896 RepID=A0A7C9JWZ0_9PROT|nr:OmpA family protein [Sulfuriferula multivorans]